MEQTLAIIKPDAVKKKYIGNIIARIERENFDIVRLKLLTLTKKKAQSFYEIHKNLSFFGELVEFMCSGPVVVMVLEKEDAVVSWRNVMGATDPDKAAEGTLRKLYGSSIGENTTHGSDSLENAKREVVFFFPEYA
jgi:nucleoside-diphosphate kinase